MSPTKLKIQLLVNQKLVKEKELTDKQIVYDIDYDLLINQLEIFLDRLKEVQKNSDDDSETANSAWSTDS